LAGTAAWADAAVSITSASTKLRRSMMAALQFGPVWTVEEAKIQLNSRFPALTAH
jgi:hypothetical protein